MSEETYTPGHTQNATRFMAKRSFESHGMFFDPYLADQLDLLDLGCGPGTISVGLAARIPGGKVVGIDFGESQIEEAKANAAAAETQNLEFQVASCYELPFPDSSFDRVFSHALMEHLKDPDKALAEALRVLRPGGVIGLCSPDADGWLLAPPSRELQAAVDCYADLQASNGGDLRIGKKFGILLQDARFENIDLSSRYECYPSLEFIGEYLALQLDQKGKHQEAQTFRDWSQSKGGMFAQAWVSGIGRKPC